MYRCTGQAPGRLASTCQNARKCLMSMPFGRAQHSCLLASALVLTLMAGCGGSSKNSRFYMLTPMPATAAEQAGRGFGKDVNLAVGPVRLPAYLDRPQIVTRVGDNQLLLGEYDRWAEPLGHNITRVLAENLSTLLNTARVVTVLNRSAGNADYQVILDLSRYDRSAGGAVTLSAHWAIKVKNVEEPVVVQKSNFTESVEGQGYAAQVAAMNRALSNLSTDIAAALRENSR